jgi:hypothetical protein
MSTSPWPPQRQKREGLRWPVRLGGAALGSCLFALTVQPVWAKSPWSSVSPRQLDLPANEETGISRERIATGEKTWIAQTGQTTTDYSWSLDWLERRRRSGGSRGDCPGRLVAVLPPGDVLTTLSPSPSLWVYASEEVVALTGAIPQFQMLNRAGEALYQGTFALPTEAGIFRLALPADLDLAAPESYEWQLALPCQPGREFLLQGQIQMLPSSEALTTDLATSSTDLDTVLLYAQAQAWHETVEVIVTNLQASQGTIAKTAWQAEWTTLLETVRLESFATAPLIDCCTLEPKEPPLPGNESRLELRYIQ